MCSQPLHLAQLSTVIMSFLWKSKRINDDICYWNNEQQFNFFKFCHNFLLLSNVADYIVYTGLKYAEVYLSRVKTNIDWISEYKLFTIAMILGYKYHEDFNTCTQPLWEMASGLVRIELSRLEWEFLSVIDYNLYICPEDYSHWYSNCNKLYDYHKSFVAIFNQPYDNAWPGYLTSSDISCFPVDNGLLKADTDEYLNAILMSNINLINLSVSDLQLSDTNTVDSGIIIHEDLYNANILDQPDLLNLTTTNTPSENWESHINYGDLFI